MILKNLWQKYSSLFWYCVFGVLTTLVNVIAYYICFNSIRIQNVSSTVIAWFLAIAFAFITNKLYVFNSKSFEWKILIHEIFAFFLCRLATGIFDVVIMWFSVDKLHWNAMVWKIISNLLVIFLNFIASKFVIFVKIKDSSK